MQECARAGVKWAPIQPLAASGVDPAVSQSAVQQTEQLKITSAVTSRVDTHTHTHTHAFMRVHTQTHTHICLDNFKPKGGLKAIRVERTRVTNAETYVH